MGQLHITGYSLPFLATGGDYHPFSSPLMSQWSRDCYKGDLEEVKKHLRVDPCIIDRRESILNVNGLFHTIYGARTLAPGFRSPSLKVHVTPTTDHIGVIQYLLEKGANPNSKDFVGNTPLHICTGAYATALTLLIAKMLIDHGADVNMPNRRGRTPLFEPSVGCLMPPIDFLLENGASVGVKDNDGVSLIQVSFPYPRLTKKFQKALALAVEKSKTELKNECVVCGSDKCKRCTGCFQSWYCSKECLKTHWKQGHKGECKAIQKEYVGVNLKGTGPDTVYCIQDHLVSLTVYVHHFLVLHNLTSNFCRLESPS